MPSHCGRALAATALLAALFGGLHVLDLHHLAPSVLGDAQLPVYATIVAASLVAAFVPGAWRRVVFAIAAVVAGAFACEWWGLALAAYTAAIVGIARAPVPIYIRLALALVTWLVLPVARIEWLGVDAQVDTITLSIIWAGQLYSAFYVIVERERESASTRASWFTDAFYMTAVPRLGVPFFQPISPMLLARSERPELPARLLWRGAGLAGYGLVSAAAAWTLGRLAHKIAKHFVIPQLAIGVEFLEFYARVTYTIFLAVAVFRLLGFNLPSGYRQPFLSRSFAEFFRRFNHYVRDAVLSLFYFPLLGNLRHHARPRVASIASAYIGILIGSFMLHDLLIPMATTIEPLSQVDYFLDPVRVGSMVLLWSLIIWPNAGIAPKKPRKMTR
ncbi:MAG TPA: hypothetical protein VGO00_02325, partial [Kofleriaceae bacterium]|nr:hypothetical protein [Kofleriaceae bacterium]